jgi:hypothetical protein
MRQRRIPKNSQQLSPGSIVTPELKRVLNLRVVDTKQMVWLVKAISELEADLAIDTRPGNVKVRIYGSKDEVRDISRKIMGLLKSQPS